MREKNNFNLPNAKLALTID